tara:strand:- start:680 stop:1210 length:531 start_codon:yes stop_codon:yes gene_type:complete
MSLVFNGPIPGQSLTTEPKNAAYERPPEVFDPLEALDVHLSNLSKPEAMEDALYFLELGLDLVTLVEGIVRSAVIEGIHSIDVSLIIAPVIHEHIKAAATKAGIDFDEGFDNPERDEAVQYERDTMRAKKMLKKLREQEGEPEELNMMEEEEPMEEEAEVETTDIAPAPMGLMARV